MSGGVARDGAELPAGGAERAPATVGRGGQSSPGCAPAGATSSPARRDVAYCSGLGMSGPGPRVATYAARAAISSGLKLTEAVALEKTPDHYLNVVAVKRTDKEAPWAKDLAEAYRSKDFQAVVDSKFRGYAKPAFLQ